MREGSELGKLDSFALGLLLGGLRGPLVMALWSGIDQQRTARELEDIDTKIELIRLLQPQFDSVHVEQIHNKAYNLSAERANAAGRYAAILDGIEYARRVNAERPGDIDIETQIGEVFRAKLGAGGEDRGYFSRRVHQETQANQPVVRIEFPAALESELRDAALVAGVSPRDLLVRPVSRDAGEGDGQNQDGRRLAAVVRAEYAPAILASFDGPDVTAVELPPPATTATGSPQRLQPMLDADGNLLPELTRARVQASGNPIWPDEVDRLDGSEIQFLDTLGPFPEGLSPYALAYEHFSKALVLQESGGQEHLSQSEMSVRANPGRALRDWALEAYEAGRQLEAEALGFEAVPRSNEGLAQQRAELLTAAVPLLADPPSPPLLRDAIELYERSRDVGSRAIEWLDRHMERYPRSANVFSVAVDRLEMLRVLLEADILYARLLLDDVPANDRAQTIADAAALYRRADDLGLTLIARYYGQDVLPPNLDLTQAGLLPLGVRDQAYRELRVLRDRRRALEPDALDFAHVRVIDEFDGIRGRIAQRLLALRRATEPSPTTTPAAE